MFSAHLTIMNVVKVAFSGHERRYKHKKPFALQQKDIAIVRAKQAEKAAIHDLGNRAGGWWAYFLTNKQPNHPQSKAISEAIHLAITEGLYVKHAPQVILTPQTPVVQQICQQYKLNTKALQAGTQMTVTRKGIWIESKQYPKYRYFPKSETNPQSK